MNQQPPVLSLFQLKRITTNESLRQEHRLIIGKTYVGRDVANLGSHCYQIPANAVLVSKRHCTVIVHQDGVINIEDTSSNGSFINDKKVHKDIAELQPGDVVALGFNPTQTSPLNDSTDFMFTFERRSEPHVQQDVSLPKRITRPTPTLRLESTHQNEPTPRVHLPMVSIPGEPSYPLTAICKKEPIEFVVPTACIEISDSEDELPEEKVPDDKVKEDKIPKDEAPKEEIPEDETKILASIKKCHPDLYRYFINNADNPGKIFKKAPGRKPSKKIGTLSKTLKKQQGSEQGRRRKVTGADVESSALQTTACAVSSTSTSLTNLQAVSSPKSDYYPKIDATAPSLPAHSESCLGSDSDSLDLPSLYDTVNQRQRRSSVFNFRESSEEGSSYRMQEKNHQSAKLRKSPAAEVVTEEKSNPSPYTLVRTDNLKLRFRKESKSNPPSPAIEPSFDTDTETFGSPRMDEIIDRLSNEHTFYPPEENTKITENSIQQSLILLRSPSIETTNEDQAAFNGNLLTVKPGDDKGEAPTSRHNETMSKLASPERPKVQVQPKSSAKRRLSCSPSINKSSECQKEDDKETTKTSRSEEKQSTEINELAPLSPMISRTNEDRPALPSSEEPIEDGEITEEASTSRHSDRPGHGERKSRHKEKRSKHERKRSRHKYRSRYERKRSKITSPDRSRSKSPKKRRSSTLFDEPPNKQKSYLKHSQDIRTPNKWKDADIRQTKAAASWKHFKIPKRKQQGNSLVKDSNSNEITAEKSTWKSSTIDQSLEWDISGDEVTVSTKTQEPDKSAIEEGVWDVSSDDDPIISIPETPTSVPKASPEVLKKITPRPTTVWPQAAVKAITQATWDVSDEDDDDEPTPPVKQTFYSQPGWKNFKGGWKASYNQRHYSPTRQPPPFARRDEKKPEDPRLLKPKYCYPSTDGGKNLMAAPGCDFMPKASPAQSSSKSSSPMKMNTQSPAQLINQATDLRDILNKVRVETSKPTNPPLPKEDPHLLNPPPPPPPPPPQATNILNSSSSSTLSPPRAASITSIGNSPDMTESAAQMPKKQIPLYKKEPLMRYDKLQPIDEIEIIKEILGWSPDWMTVPLEQTPILTMYRPKKLQDQFSSFQEYLGIMSNLFTLEIFYAVSCAYRSRIRSPIPGELIKITSVLPQQKLLVLQGEIEFLPVEKHSRYLQHGTLLILQFSRQHLHLAYVDKSDDTSSPKINLTLFVSSHESFLQMALGTTLTVMSMRCMSKEIEYWKSIQALAYSSLKEQIINPCKMKQFRAEIREEYRPLEWVDLNQGHIIEEISYTIADDEVNIFLIDGPAGTGKSLLLNHLLTKFEIGSEHINSRRTLVVTNSDASIDALVKDFNRINEKLWTKDKIKIRFVRFGEKVYGQEFTVDALVNEKIRLEKKKVADFFDSKHPLYIERADLMATRVSLRKDLDIEYNEDERKLICSKLNVLDREISEKENQIFLIQFPYENMPTKKKQLATDMLYKFDVVFTTIRDSTKLSSMYPDILFDTLIVDDASTATEYQILTPLRYGVKSLIMIGDSKLTPVPDEVLCSIAKTHGLNTSLFNRIKRLAKSEKIETYSLVKQYRMHPQILAFPMHEFYQERPQISSRAHRRCPLRPYVVFNVNSNKLKFVNDLLCTIKMLTRFNNIPCTVLAASHSLCRDIQNSFLNHGELRNTEVTTIDNIVGTERDIIIFVCGYINGNPLIEERLKIALTRAKFCLFICGDFNQIENSPVPNTWKRLVLNAKVRKHFVDATYLDSFELLSNCIKAHENAIPQKR